MKVTQSTKNELARILETLPPEGVQAVLDTATGLAVGRIRAEIVNDWRLMSKLHQAEYPHDVVDLGMLHVAEERAL